MRNFRARTANRGKDKPDQQVYIAIFRRSSRKPNLLIWLARIYTKELPRCCDPAASKMVSQTVWRRAVSLPRYAFVTIKNIAAQNNLPSCFFDVSRYNADNAIRRGRFYGKGRLPGEVAGNGVCIYSEYSLHDGSGQPEITGVQEMTIIIMTEDTEHEETI